MQIIAFLLLVLVVMLLLSAKKESVQPRVKYAIAGAFVCLTIIALVYETQFSKKQDSNRMRVNHFVQGGSLTCKDKIVDNIHYRFENGTQSFVAKKEYKELSGIIVDLRDCEVTSK
jgi:hypothetical protein